MGCRPVFTTGMERTRKLQSLFILLVLLGAPGLTLVSFAQTPARPLGRTPTAEELRAIDIEVLPDGRGLPEGHGTAQAGRAVYERHCRTCHGATGTEGPNDALAGGRGSLTTTRPIKTVGSYWPYATTVWDYINRAMPFAAPRSLAANDVYAVTAYVLFLNGIVTEQQIVSRATLPAIAMPNRNGFIQDTRRDEHLSGK